MSSNHGPGLTTVKQMGSSWPCISVVPVTVRGKMETLVCLIRYNLQQAENFMYFHCTQYKKSYLILQERESSKLSITLVFVYQPPFVTSDLLASTELSWGVLLWDHFHISSNKFIMPITIQDDFNPGHHCKGLPEEIE